MTITITDLSHDMEIEIAKEVSADEFLESTEYDTEWEDILNYLESEQLDEVDFSHSDGTEYNIIKELEFIG